MTPAEARRQYWRIPVIAALGAVLAFASSFLITPTYESSTRLVIYGRDASLLSSSGADQTDQPTLSDSSQAKTLADTYGSIATSRGLAASVVDDLDLDRRDGGGGVIGTVTGGFAWVYRCSRAFITAGFCASVDHRKQAIAEVQEGTTAEQLGNAAGQAAGQPGSYVLEITSSGDSGRQAARVTDAVADALVAKSSDMVADNLAAYTERLQTQVDQARQEVGTAADAVTQFETANNVSESDQQFVVQATSYDELRASLNTARADLVDAQAQSASLAASLASTPATVDSNQQIDTGRSGTSISTSQQNPVYADLLTQRNANQAEITGLQARISALEGQVASGSPTQLSGTLAQLGSLQADLTAAQTRRDDLAQRLSDAQVQAAVAAPELSRIDRAGEPAYPVGPKRYLYLLIGLLLGALAGGALTWWVRRRTPGPEDPDAEGTAEQDVESTRGLEELGFDEELLDEVDGDPGRRQRLPQHAELDDEPRPRAPTS